MKARWTQRNEDKPHRCPICHAVCTWDHKRHGPRTVLRHCGVQWRVGYRKKRESMKWGWLLAPHGEYSKPRRDFTHDS